LSLHPTRQVCALIHWSRLVTRLLPESAGHRIQNWGTANDLHPRTQKTRAFLRQLIHPSDFTPDELLTSFLNSLWDQTPQEGIQAFRKHLELCLKPLSDELTAATKTQVLARAQNDEKLRILERLSGSSDTPHFHSLGVFYEGILQSPLIHLPWVTAFPRVLRQLPQEILFEYAFQWPDSSETFWKELFEHALTHAAGEGLKSCEGSLPSGMRIEVQRIAGPQTERVHWRLVSGRPTLES